MPQTTMYKGLEACYVNRLIDFANFLFLTEQIRLSLDSFLVNTEMEPYLITICDEIKNETPHVI